MHEVIVMAEVTGFSLSIPNTLDVRKVLGKKVLAKNGETIGGIDTLQFGPSKLSVEGIRVKTGFFSSPERYIPRQFIDTLNEEGAVLNVFPLDENVGKEVYDEGKRIGKVDRVNRLGPSGDMLAIVVGRGRNQADLVIREKNVKEIGQNVILNISAAEA